MAIPKAHVVGIALGLARLDDGVEVAGRVVEVDAWVEGRVCRAERSETVREHSEILRAVLNADDGDTRVSIEDSRDLGDDPSDDGLAGTVSFRIVVAI